MGARKCGEDMAFRWPRVMACSTASQPNAWLGGSNQSLGSIRTSHFILENPPVFLVSCLITLHSSASDIAAGSCEIGSNTS